MHKIDKKINKHDDKFRVPIIFLEKLKQIMTLNIAAKWSELLFHIQEVPRSNVVPEHGYYDKFFMVFPSPSKKMLG
jgi:hypothetical protein